MVHLKAMNHRFTSSAIRKLMDYGGRVAREHVQKPLYPIFEKGAVNEL